MRSLVRFVGSMGHTLLLALCLLRNIVTQSKINNLKPEKLAEGAMKCIINAQELCQESKLLHEHEMYSRSYALSHFAREELSKALMLYVAMIKVVNKGKVDWKQLNRQFRDHKEKIEHDKALTYWYLKLNGGENEFNEQELFSGVEFANHRKNECLYVDWQEGDFVSPSQVITKELSHRNLNIAGIKVTHLSEQLLKLNKLLELDRKSVQVLLGKEFLEDPKKFMFERYGLK